jgi:hypothetical protein
LVGSYKTGDDHVYGFIYKGTVEQLSDPTKYTAIVTGAKFTYVHSVMGHFAVGNTDNPLQYGQFNLPLGPGNAFLYNTITKTHVPILYTAYGIWHNGKNSYTICGGYSKLPVSIDSIYVNRGGVMLPKPIAHGYLVNYDSKTKQFSGWTTFDYPIPSFLTHFEGISSSKPGQYEIAADVISSDFQIGGKWLQVKVDKCGFKAKKWVNLNYPESEGPLSANSVAGKAVVGIAIISDTIVPYQASILL